MIDEAIIGLRFSTNFRAPQLDAFDSLQWLCLLAFQVINYVFCVVCIILLVRLLMAMMTNTFRLVQEKARRAEGVQWCELRASLVASGCTGNNDEYIKICE